MTSDDDAPQSISSAARLFGRDRASIRAALTGIAGDAPAVKRQQRWRTGTLRAAILAHDSRMANARATNENAALGGPISGDVDDEGLEALKVEKLGYLRARRAALERENLVAMAKLVPVDQIEPPLAEFNAIIRSNVLRIPTCAPQLTGRPVTEIFQILTDRCNEALGAISSEDNPEFQRLLENILTRAEDAA